MRNMKTLTKTNKRNAKSRKTKQLNMKEKENFEIIRKKIDAKNN